MGCTSSSHTKNPSVRVASLSNLKIKPENFVVHNPKPFQEEYKISVSLGSGAFGEVRKVIHRSTNEVRAVKIFRKNLALTAADHAKLTQEINILRSLDHPNIIRVYEFFEDSKCFYIVMEKCNGGELFEEILKRSYFGETQAAIILHQLFSAVAYLHDNDIIHRDLKPENILLEEKGDIMNIKLIDFGTAIRVEPGRSVKGAIGTAYYIAPEVLAGSYNNKCDLWSCGVIIFILLAGYPPFDGQDDQEILEKVKKSNYNFSAHIWDTISKEAKDLISCLLAPSSTRYTAKLALAHPWLKNNFQNQSLDSQTVRKTLNNLQNFHKSSKLRDAVGTFIITQCVSAADTREIRKIFQAMDTNGDGKLSREELYNYYSKEMGEEHAEEEAKKIMNEVDTDNSGFVDYSEFLKAALDSKTMASAVFLKRAFDMFDKDGNGNISTSELKKILVGGSVIEDDVWNQIVKDLGSNINADIDYNTFEKLIISKI